MAVLQLMQTLLATPFWMSNGIATTLIVYYVKVCVQGTHQRQ